MSTKTGIQPDAELASHISKTHDPKCRIVALVIVIEDVHFITAQKIEAIHSQTEGRSAAWQRLLDERVRPQLDVTKPAYILLKYRPSADLWILISWSPESAPVRHKMVHATSKAEFKTAFGAARICCNITATECSELESQTCMSRIVNQDGGTAHDDVLSDAERQRREVDRLQRLTAVLSVKQDQGFGHASPLSGVGTRSSSQLRFSLTDAARKRINQFAANAQWHYVQLCIDESAEAIDVVEGAALHHGVTAPIDSQSTLDKIWKPPQDIPAYHLMRIRSGSSHGAKSNDVVVFVHTMVDHGSAENGNVSSTSAIRTRMLYSTCKAGLLHNLQSGEFGNMTISRRFELDSDEVVNFDGLLATSAAALGDTSDCQEYGAPNQTSLCSQLFKRPVKPGARKQR